MWEQYKKTAIPMQGMILIALLAVYFTTGRQLMPILLLLLVMEVGAVFGAIWAVSLKHRFQSRQGQSPLLRRRLSASRR